MGANVSPLFQSMHPDIIHSHSVCLSFFLSHSDALRCVRSYIHHLSRASVFFYLAHTHTQAGNTFCPFYYQKKKREKKRGFWWLNDPMHPLISHLDITFISCNLFRGLCQRGSHYASLSLLYGYAVTCISRDKHKRWGKRYF